jgi:hypothetical protein
MTTYGQSDHTWCPALASGYAGYTSTPFTSPHWTAYQSYLCGPRYQEWWPNGTAGVYFRGAAYNPNGSTFDTFDWAAYDW